MRKRKNPTKISELFSDKKYPSNMRFVNADTREKIHNIYDIISDLLQLERSEAVENYKHSSSEDEQMFLKDIRRVIILGEKLDRWTPWTDKHFLFVPPNIHDLLLLAQLELDYQSYLVGNVEHAYGLSIPLDDEDFGLTLEFKTVPTVIKELHGVYCAGRNIGFISEVLQGKLTNRPPQNLKELADLFFGNSAYTHLINTDFLSATNLDYDVLKEEKFKLFSNSIKILKGLKATQNEIDFILKFYIFHGANLVVPSNTLVTFEDKEIVQGLKDMLYIIRNRIDYSIENNTKILPDLSTLNSIPMHFADSISMAHSIGISLERAHNLFKKYENGEDLKIKIKEKTFDIEYDSIYNALDPSSREDLSEGRNGKEFIFHDFMAALKDVAGSALYLLDTEMPEAPFPYPEKWEQIRNTTDLFDLSKKYGWCARDEQYLEAGIKGKIYFFFYKGVAPKYNALIGYKTWKDSDSTTPVDNVSGFGDLVVHRFQSYEPNNARTHPAPEWLTKKSILLYMKEIIANEHEQREEMGLTENNPRRKRRSDSQHKIGYSTSDWTPYSELKRYERSRGNQWKFKDTDLDKKAYEGIWVTLDPKDLIPYVFGSEYRDMPMDHLKEALGDKLEDFFENAEGYSVDLTGATKIIADGDGGFVFIRKKKP
jgi:hypothetical protein